MRGTWIDVNALDDDCRRFDRKDNKSSCLAATVAAFRRAAVCHRHRASGGVATGGAPPDVHGSRGMNGNSSGLLQRRTGDNEGAEFCHLLADRQEIPERR